VNKELQLLIALQEKDNVLIKLRENAAAIPKKIEEIAEAMNKNKAEIDNLKGNTKKLLMARKEKEIELETKENEIKKHNMELNSVKSNDAYKALVNEIERCKNTKQVLEEEILQNMEETDTESKKSKEEETKFKGQEAGIQAQADELKKELEKANAEIAALENERNVFIKDIPEEYLSKYEHIKDGRQGIAIVPIEGDVCGGCFITLRPQIINQVCKAHDVIYCDSCSRILYKK
jgi:hypothetical protein